MEAGPWPPGARRCPGHGQGARAEVGGHHVPVGLQGHAHRQDAGAGADVRGVQDVQPPPTSRAASSTSSVSGRGIRVSGVTWKRRPRNGAQPRR